MARFVLPASQQVRDNEAAHERVAQRVEGIRTYLHEIDQHAVTARTRRRLFGKVVGSASTRPTTSRKKRNLSCRSSVSASLRNSKSRWRGVSSSLRPERTSEAYWTGSLKT